jgi:YD repeat-containing protein
VLYDGVRSLTWDARNRPAQITVAGGFVTFAYAPYGTRLKKTTLVGTTLYLAGDIEIAPDGRMGCNTTTLPR